MSLVFFILIIISFYCQNFSLVFGLSFITGLFADLWLGNILGSSSLIFLSLVFLIFLYRQKFSSRHILFQIATVFIFNLFFNWLKLGKFSAKNSLLFLVLTLVIFLLLKKIKTNSGSLALEV